MVMQGWMLQSYDAHELAELSDKRVDKYVDGLYLLIVYIVGRQFRMRACVHGYTELYLPTSHLIYQQCTHPLYIVR
jgi:predicted HAD superfamily hydrolase